jgi:hypothetical protein
MGGGIQWRCYNSPLDTNQSRENEPFLGGMVLYCVRHGKHGGCLW